MAATLATTALTGCSSNAYPETYSSVEELRDAFVKAGGECPEWEQRNQVSLSAESGECSSQTVLSIYSSESDRDQVVNTQKELHKMVDMGGMHLLVGANWIINDPNVKDLDRAIGGIFITTD